MQSNYFKCALNSTTPSTINRVVLSSNFGASREQGLDGDNCSRNRLFAYKCINVFLYLVPTIDVDPGDALEKKTNGAAIAVSIVAALLVAVIIITVMVLVAWVMGR